MKPETGLIALGSALAPTGGEEAARISELVDAYAMEGGSLLAVRIALTRYLESYLAAQARWDDLLESEAGDPFLAEIAESVATQRRNGDVQPIEDLWEA